MAAFRILSQSPVYFLLDGVTPAAGGRLEFYEAGTTMAKDVYGDPDLTVNNGSSVELGSDGRATADIWGSGSYRVRVYAADDTLISDDDNVEIPGGTGTAIPALEAGKVLSNDGATLQWLALEETPDPSGQSGKILGSDGTSYIWQNAPTAPDAPLTVLASTFQAGNTSGRAFYVQKGSAQAPASGAGTTTKSVDFSKQFKELFIVIPIPTSTNVTSAGFNPIPSLAARSTSGFTVQFDINEGTGGFGIVNPVNFDWVAFGTIDVA